MCRWWPTTSNHTKTGPISCGAGQASSLRECDYQATTLRTELRIAVGVNISTQTVRNCLRQRVFRSRTACICIPLTRLHKQARLSWAQDHVNWTDNDWDPVLFTDESRYFLDFTDLSTCSSTVYVRPYAGAIGPQFILMDDNARPRRARVAEEYLQQDTIIRMDWAAWSPDLKPIEHVWSMLQVAILRRPVQPTALVELGNALTEEWNNLEMAAIQRLIGWMISRSRLPGCDYITWVTYKLLTVVASGIFNIFMTWTRPGVTL